MKKVSVCLAFILLAFCAKVFAWDDKATHPLITETAVRNSTLDSYLKDILNLDAGIETIGEDGKALTQTILLWMRYGSEMEDDPMCRSSNHFHNPLKDWNKSGLTDTSSFINSYCNVFEGEYPSGDIQSAISWATGFKAPATPDDETLERNQWDWESAREYYYAYMTEHDERCLVSCFRALGQVLHMLQDVAVPAHVRNDFSEGHEENIPKDIPKKKFTDHWGNNFEAYVKKYSTRDNTEWFHAGGGININEISLTNFWDAEKYTGTAASIESNLTQTGLAEYTNFNFISKGAMLAEQHEKEDAGDHYFPFPNKARLDNDLTDYDSRPPVVNGKFKDKPIFTYSIGTTTSHGEKITNLIKPSYLTFPIKTHKDIAEGREGYNKYVKSFILDRDCFKDAAALLIPRSIDYSAALIDYFFRGKLDITADNDTMLIDPVRRCIDRLEMTVTNASPDGEDIEHAELTLVIKYRFAEDDPFTYLTAVIDDDFSLKVGEQTPVSPSYYSTGLSRWGIPLDATDVSVSLVCRGKLGTEENGIAVGKISNLKIPKTASDIEITLPERGVYAVTGTEPAEPRTQGFEKIMLDVKNSNSSTPLNPDSSTAEFVVRYRLPSYNPFTYRGDSARPQPSSENYFISKKKSFYINPGDTESYTLDLTEQNLPLWAIDIYAYIIWKSGDDYYWTKKDIAEPAPVLFWNASDYICIRGNKWIAGSDEAINEVDYDNNGEPDEDIYPHKMKGICIRFYRADNPQKVKPDYPEKNSWNHEDEVGPGEHFVIYIMTDSEYAINFSKGYNYLPTDERDSFFSHGYNEASSTYSSNTFSQYIVPDTKEFYTGNGGAKISSTIFCDYRNINYIYASGTWTFIGTPKTCHWYE